MNSSAIVLIFGLMRTGTTLLQELLTIPPYSFIFHEPWFHRHRFLNADLSKKILREKFDVELHSLMYPWKEPIHYLYDASRQVHQVGVKEIRLFGWQRYEKFFNKQGLSVKIILLLRNPCHVYLSCANRHRLSTAWVPHYQPFGPNNLAKELAPDLTAHAQLLEKDNVLPIAYENLCANFEITMQRIKVFIDSPAPYDLLGKPGDFHKLIPRGTYEVDKHKGCVTTRSMRPEALTEADMSAAVEFARLPLFADYTSAWNEVL